MPSDPLLWLLRLMWLSLPFTMGESISAAVDGRSTAVAATAAGLGWAAWAVGLVASFVTMPVALTALRWVVPAAPIGAAALLFVDAPNGDGAAGTSVLGVIGLAAALVSAACASSGEVADVYANGASYGDERRFALRIPIGFLLGAVPTFWIVSVAGTTIGALLLAAKAWVGGAILTAIGVATLVVALRAFHALNRRWLVFVPAGITVVDHLALVDPALFPKARISRFGPAYNDTTAKDLTSNTPGLVLEVAFDMQLDIAARTGADGGEVELVGGVLLCPVRPGAVMAEATRRGVKTSTT